MLFNQSLLSLSEGLRKKQFSSVELTQESLKHIQSQQSLNAVLSINTEHSISQAKQADQRLTQTNATLLTGIPIAHKDVLVTTHFPTTAASKILHGYMSPFDAHVVEKLDRAGMITVAKTNCDEFAMGSTNENSAYGAVQNPWDPSAVPGGSSGGSAVVVASRAVAASTGTDTGGSIRQPSGFCGITGIKPTYGACSRFGLIAYASSLDQAGPMAKSAEDCALLLNEMVGFDERDSTSIAHPVSSIWQACQKRLQSNLNSNASKPLQGLKIGVAVEHFTDGVSSEVLTALEEALKTYEQLGASRVKISLPRTHLSIPTYYVIAAAEASSNLSRFDGVRYGHRANGCDTLDEVYVKSRSEGFGEEVKRRILTGTFVLSHGYYDAYYNKALQVRQLIRQDFERAFEQCDVILSPVAPTVAWGLNEKNDDPVAMYLADIFTLAINLAGLPALSHPVGFGGVNKKRPIGAQLIGKAWDEVGLLTTAMFYQRVTNWHLNNPND